MSHTVKLTFSGGPPPRNIVQHSNAPGYLAGLLLGLGFTLEEVSSNGQVLRHPYTTRDATGAMDDDFLHSEEQAGEIALWKYKAMLRLALCWVWFLVWVLMGIAALRMATDDMRAERSTTTAPTQEAAK